MSLHHFVVRSNNPNDCVQHPCVISAVDEDLLHKYQWHYDVDTKRIVAGFRRGEIVHLAHLVAERAHGARTSMSHIVDHHNNDRSDNSRPNLHYCTRAVNSMNIAARQGCSSKYKGVWSETRRGKLLWRARLKSSVGGKKRTINCGTHATETAAALAYDLALRAFVLEHAAAPQGKQLARAARFNMPRTSEGERSAL